MPKSAKILLGVLSIWPVVYFFLFMAFVVWMISLPPEPTVYPNRRGFMLLIVAHLFTMMLMLGLTVFYFIHALMNENLKTEIRALWAVLFFVGGMIAEPVYWYLHIWNAKDGDASFGQLGAGSTSTWDFESRRVREEGYEPPDWR